MKLDFIVDLKLNEIEGFAWASMLFGAISFIVVALWDKIVGIGVHHHEGFGWMQITALAVIGLYTFWAWSIQYKWKE